eukprot:3016558-Rhodomonas_salina.2
MHLISACRWSRRRGITRGKPRAIGSAWYACPPICLSACYALSGTGISTRPTMKLYGPTRRRYPCSSKRGQYGLLGILLRVIRKFGYDGTDAAGMAVGGGGRASLSPATLRPTAHPRYLPPILLSTLLYQPATCIVSSTALRHLLRYRPTASLVLSAGRGVPGKTFTANVGEEAAGPVFRAMKPGRAR